MKVIVKLATLMLVITFTSGCTVAMSPAGAGIFYTNATYTNPFSKFRKGEVDESTLKTGKATCTNILGVVASGDCSIAVAKKNGGITEVLAVDTKVKSIFVFYSKYTLIVKGK